MVGSASQSSRGDVPDLRQPGTDRGAPLFFTFDGRAVPAYPGETIAAALLAAGIRTLRRSPRADHARGAFCWMGLCQECTVVVGGERKPACRTPVAEGLSVLPGTIA